MESIPKQEIQTTEAQRSVNQLALMMPDLDFEPAQLK
jgi:hypothetical protein